MATYTSNYKLHQWEPEDDFLRTDFNEDFAKIDTAVKGVADKAKADTQALTGSTNSQFQTLTAKAATAPVVIAQTTLAADNNTITLSLSGKNLGQYTTLRLLFWGQGRDNDAFCYLRVNGKSTSNGYSSKMLDGVLDRADGMRLPFCQTLSNGGSVYDIRLYTAGGRIFVHGCGIGYNPNGVTGDEMHGCVHFCGLSGVSSVSITLGNQGIGPYPFAAGAKVILLGYKF